MPRPSQSKIRTGWSSAHLATPRSDAAAAEATAVPCARHDAFRRRSATASSDSVEVRGSGADADADADAGATADAVGRGRWMGALASWVGWTRPANCEWCSSTGASRRKICTPAPGHDRGSARDGARLVVEGARRNGAPSSGRSGWSMRSSAHGVVARARVGEQTTTAKANARSDVSDVGRRRVAECRDERGRGPAASRWDARERTSGISRGDRAGLTRPRLWRGGTTRRTVQRERVGNVWEGGKKFERSSATRVVVVDSTQEIRIRAVGVRERRRVTALAAAARGATAPVGRADGHTPPRRTREPAGF